MNWLLADFSSIFRGPCQAAGGAPVEPCIHGSTPSEAAMCVPREPLVIEYRELVHRLAPLLGRAAPVSRDVAQGQPDQLGGGIVAGEVAARLDDLAQLTVQTRTHNSGQARPHRTRLRREAPEPSTTDQHAPSRLPPSYPRA